MAQGIDSTKTPARPSHESVEATGGEATDLAKTEQQKIDHIAMEAAKRGQNRIHADETSTPGSSIFTNGSTKSTT